MKPFVLAASILTYGLNDGVHLNYDVRVLFDGFIPILGGQEGKVEVKLKVPVEGLKPEKDGTLRAASEIADATILFNDAPLPLTADNVREFFPRTTIELSLAGRILKTDAPDRTLPVRLPGLDIKRFPDITYLPIEFGAEPPVVGQTWTFEKAFGDSRVVYRCTPVSLTEDSVKLKLSIKQTYETWEDAGLNVVEKEADAVAKVSTALDGEGEAEFDPKRGIIKHLLMEATAVSEVKPTDGTATTTRRLKTRLETTLREPKSEKAPMAPPSTLSQRAIQVARDWGDQANRWLNGTRIVAGQLVSRTQWLGPATRRREWAAWFVGFRAP